MTVAALVLPVFAVIVAGWLAGALGYLPRTLAGPLVTFAYQVAMPALVFLTIAGQKPAVLLDGRFIAAFGGGSALCFLVVFLAARLGAGRPLGASAMAAAAAAMTNTGFVALPILQALYGQRGVVMAAVATLFVGAVMFPALVLLLEADGGSGRRTGAAALARQVLLNPVMLSTGGGLAWSLAGLPLPAPVAAFTAILGEALTPCALFAVGLGLSLADLRRTLGSSALLAAVKLLGLPALVYAIGRAVGLGPFEGVAAVVCAAVPTAKTAYVLAGAYRAEETMVGAVISLTTLVSVATLLGWLAVLG